jgi:hypothetical protein
MRRGKYGEIRNSFQVLVENPDVKRPLATPRRRYDDYIK